MDATSERVVRLMATLEPVNAAELSRIEGGGFWGRLAESVGRLGEGVGVVTSSPLLILAGRAIYK